MMNFSLVCSELYISKHYFGFHCWKVHWWLTHLNEGNISRICRKKFHLRWNPQSFVHCSSRTTCLSHRRNHVMDALTKRTLCNSRSQMKAVMVTMKTDWEFDWCWKHTFVESEHSGWWKWEALKIHLIVLKISLENVSFSVQKKWSCSTGMIAKEFLKQWSELQAFPATLS